MRRNSSRGHGGGGPLMTDHLQLQDIDLELELLKRKREMIEQQQQRIITSSLSNSAFNFPSPFNPGQEPRPLFETHPFGSGYSRGFDPRQSSAFGNSSHLGKRPMNDNSWQSSPKRFAGPQSGSRKKFNSGPSPKQNQSRPAGQRAQGSYGQPRNNSQGNKPQPPRGSSSNFPSQRFNSSKQTKPEKKDFRPTKVVKPTPAPSGNKPSSNRPANFSERAKFAKEANAAKVEKSCILLADKVPSQQMAGRLELALGNILKEIRTRYAGSPRHVAAFQSMYLQRKMKQAIRERLRAAIMGKQVGKVGTIVEDYRLMYPVETDEDIVQIAFDTPDSNEMKNLAIRLENADNVHKYFKTNMNRLISATLDDIIQKIIGIYDNEKSVNTLDICNDMLSVNRDAPNGSDKEETNKNETAEETVGNDTVVESDKVDNVVETETEKANGEPMEDSGKPETATEDGPVGSDNQSANDKVQAVENKDQDGKSTTVDEEPKTESGNDTQDVENKEEKDKYDVYTRRLDELALSLMRRRLPIILSRQKHNLTKILNVCGSYQITKTAIIEKSQEKLIAALKEEQANESNSNMDASLNKTAEETPTQAGTPQYIVKILGRPALPKRKVMQAFLDEFSPISVKKHKNMHLLFVAFDNKENFDKIVAVKESTLGNATIFIKVSEKTTPKSDETLNTTAESLNATGTESLNATGTESLDTSDPQKESSGDAPFSDDLGDQIDDLLNTIKNDETPGSEGDCEVANDDQQDTNGDNEDTANGDDSQEAEVETEESKDKVEELKNDAKDSGKSTPTRASARVANVTPSSVRTRRASRLAQNN